MSRKYKITDQSKFYFVSFATVGWIDLFIRPVYAEVIIDSLSFCQKEKGLLIGAWCIMPSHIHLIIGTEGKEMQSIVRDFKSYTSTALRERIENNPQESRKKWLLQLFQKAGSKNSNNKNWQLWQQHYHPIILDSNELIDQKLNYLHDNPVKAGFVEEAIHWNYSSAKNYAGVKGPINIHFLD